MTSISQVKVHEDETRSSHNLANEISAVAKGDSNLIEVESVCEEMLVTARHTYVSKSPKELPFLTGDLISVHQGCNM